MNKNKIFSLGLASSLFMLGLNVNVNAVESKGVVSSELTNNIYEEFKGYSRIDILGNNYDLSNVDSAVLQIIAKKFDAINGGSLSDDKIKEYQKEIMDLLDDYNKDPKKYENLPVTLDLNPVTFLREEIVIVQNKINSLKAEQDNLKISDIGQDYIDKKVEEIQLYIDNLISWINYSVVNFKSSEYKQTFTENLFKENKFRNEQLINMVYVDSEYKNVFIVNVNLDGSFSSDSNDITDLDLNQVIKKGLEYENLKIRNINEEIDKIRKSKIDVIDQENMINELNRQIESAKAYSLAQEIVLLNLEIDAIKSSKASVDFINNIVEELTDEINSRIDSIIKHNSDPKYVINDFEVGKKPTYFGYVLGNEDGFLFKLNLDSDFKMLVDNVIGEEYKFTTEQKDVLKNLLNNSINDSIEKISKLKDKKLEISKSMNNNKYYLTDSIDKDISILENNILNYKSMISQI